MLAYGYEWNSEGQLPETLREVSLDCSREELDQLIEFLSERREEAEGVQLDSLSHWHFPGLESCLDQTALRLYYFAIRRTTFGQRRPIECRAKDTFFADVCRNCARDRAVQRCGRAGLIASAAIDKASRSAKIAVEEPPERGSNLSLRRGGGLPAYGLKRVKIRRKSKLGNPRREKVEQNNLGRAQTLGRTRTLGA